MTLVAGGRYFRETLFRKSCAALGTAVYRYQVYCNVYGNVLSKAKLVVVHSLVNVRLFAYEEGCAERKHCCWRLQQMQNFCVAPGDCSAGVSVVVYIFGFTVSGARMCFILEYTRVHILCIHAGKVA